MAGIIYSEYYLPSKLVEVRDILSLACEGNSARLDFFLSQSGLQHIYVEEDRDELEILKSLIRDALLYSQVLPGEITHLIYTDYSSFMKGDICLPYLLQRLFDFSNASIILMSQHCGSALQAIQVAAALIDASTANKVMILATSFGTPLKNRYIETTVIGDGAGIMVLGSVSTSSRVVDTVSVSDGMFSYPKYRNEAQLCDHIDIIKKGTDKIARFLEKNDLSPKALKGIVPQNINHYGFTLYAKFLKLPTSIFFTKNISLGGHMTSVDTIRNYTDFIREEHLEVGDKFLLYGLGTINLDVSYNAVLLELNNRIHESGPVWVS